MSLKQKYWFLGQETNLVLVINGINNGNELEIVDFFPYLGMVFSYTGSFAQTQLIYHSMQGRKAMYSLHMYEVR